MRRFLLATIAGLSILGAAHAARADAIPYPGSGTPNPTTYSFTAAATGDVMAYFTGSGAAYSEQVGLLVNGVLSPNGFGLPNHSSSIGQDFDLGHVAAGDALVFVLDVFDPDLGNVYSDPSLNTGFDDDGSAGHNHIYSTAYTVTNPVYPGVPAGTYIAFEDLPFPNSDFNYFDETYVFTNVDATPSVPEPASLALLGGGLAALGLARRRKAA